MMSEITTNKRSEVSQEFIMQSIDKAKYIVWTELLDSYQDAK